MTAFVRNAWYAIATSEEVARNLLPRQALGDRLVLYRTVAGEPVALADLCPHRFAPLSLGVLSGDEVECGYHGMRFDCSGKCVRVPGQSRIPPPARIRRYPVAERYGLVWIWPGDEDKADPAMLVEIGEYGRPGWGISRGYSHFRSRLENITDNLIDPAHTSFVHKRTIGSQAGEDVPIEVTVDGDTVTAGRWINDSPPVPIVARFARPRGNVDRWQIYHLRAPSISCVDFGSFDAGTPHTEEHKARAPYRVFSYAMLTPETAGSTHYFWMQLRNFAADDVAVTEEFERLFDATFEEDRVLLEAIQQREDENPELVPLRIASDAGLARLRRIVRRMLEEEATARSRAE